MNIEDLNIHELETYFNLTQMIIDTIIRTNHSMLGNDNISQINKELSKYNKIRDKFLFEIARRIESVSGYNIVINDDNE